jgi:hypothetical protein
LLKKSRPPLTSRIISTIRNIKITFPLDRSEAQQYGGAREKPPMTIHSFDILLMTATKSRGTGKFVAVVGAIAG